MLIRLIISEAKEDRVPEGRRKMKILVALDSSDFSKVISDYLVSDKFLAAPQSEFNLIHVLEPLRLSRPWNMLPSAMLDEKSEQEECKAKEFLEGMRSALQEKFPQSRISTSVIEGFPKEEIVRFAEDEECDLIVVGAQGRSGFTRMLMGSVSQAVCLTAHCSVLVVKAERK